MKERLVYLDFLKGIALAGVILVHFVQIWGSPSRILSIIGYGGARCPQIFFIVSAYLTWFSLSKQQGLNRGFLINFYKKRFVKLAPMYYIGLLLATFIPIVKITDWNILDFSTHLTFTNGLFPDLINKWNVEWYIADLVLFYLLAPIFYRFAHNLKSSLWTLLGITVLNMGFTVFTNDFFSSSIGVNENNEMFFHTFCIINQLPVLMMGVVLFYLIKWIKEKEIRVWKVLSCLAIVILLILGLFVVLHLNKRLMTSSFIAGLIFSWLFVALSADNQLFNRGGWCCKRLIINILCKLGVHSYGIYCLHYILIKLLSSLEFMADFKQNILATLLVYVIIVFSSYQLGRFVEKHTAI